MPWPALLLASVLAACIPTLLAIHQPPSATLLNQCVAVAMWGGLLAVLSPRLVPTRGSLPLLGALALVGAAAAASWLGGTLPRSLALQAIGLLAGAALMVLAGAAAARDGQGVPVFAALAWGLLVAGVLGALVALVQVFAPAWADGTWIAASGLPGRAVGNLRQPNHLCSLLMWALAAAAGLHALGRLRGGLLVPLGVLLVLGIELTASRTGAIGLALLLLWGLADRRLPRGTRLALIATPLLYAAAWAAMGWWGDLHQQTLGAGARLAADAGGLGESSPNARPNIWRNALLMIAADPWRGTGFGEFNFAWSLTPFVNRPTAFFDHTHNLPLQLLVELGVPLGGAVLALLAWALVAAWRLGTQGGDDARVRAGRTALVLVLLTGIHSMVEYPLWYAYFLLPAALAWGLLLGGPAAGDARRPTAEASRMAGQLATHSTAGLLATTSTAGLLATTSTAGLLAGVAMATAGALAVVDYQRVVVIYAPQDSGSTLASRITRGQLSLLFAHQADYAAATNEAPPASRALGFLRATHALLDTRLMMAWARQLDASGHTDEARWVAARLRDFRNADATEFFAPCSDAAAPAAGLPFQCQPPHRAHAWRALASLPPLMEPANASAAVPPTTDGQPAASATQ